MARFGSWLVCLLFGLVLVHSFQTEPVHWGDNRFLDEHLANKGPYHSPPTPYLIPDTCNVEHVELILRHGIRYPSPSSDYSWLVNLVNNGTTLKWLTKDFVKDLTTEWLANGDMMNDRGKAEVLKFGQHLAKTEPFKQFQDQPEQTEVYINNNSTRLLETADYLTMGLFGTKIDRELFRFGVPEQFSDSKEVLNIKDKSRSRLHKSDLFATLQHKISIRMGVENVSESTVLNLWEACAYELSLYNRSYQFCSLFDEDDIYFLEYDQDLRLFGQDLDSSSYYEWLLSKLMHYEQDFTYSSNSSPKLEVHVVHDHNLYPLLRYLAIMTSPCESMQANATMDFMKKPRDFRYHQVTYQSNVVATLLRCKGVDEPVVQIALNERSVQLPIENCQTSSAMKALNNPTLCELSKVVEFYEAHPLKSLPEPPYFFCSNTTTIKSGKTRYVEMPNATLRERLKQTFRMDGNYYVPMPEDVYDEMVASHANTQQSFSPSSSKSSESGSFFSNPLLMLVSGFSAVLLIALIIIKIVLSHKKQVWLEVTEV